MPNDLLLLIVITNYFIIESLKVVLKKNNVLFDDHLYLQSLGTAMGTKCAPPRACLTIGYLEETKLFTMNYQNISIKMNAS